MRASSNAPGSISSAKPKFGTTVTRPRKRSRPTLKTSSVLSDEFYKEVIAHPIPADMEAVKAFGSAPAVLDLFMWLTYRCFTAKSEERIPLFGDFGRTAQLGSVEYSRPRRFRAMLEQWLGQVRAVWPKCPAQICSDGQYLRLSPAKAVLPTTA